jgi:di/tricarboxylate transporter
MFEITKLGLPIALAGILLLVLLAPLLLPERRPARRDLGVNVREFVVNLEVVDKGPLDGSSVEGGGLRHLQGVYLVEVDRDGELIAPVPPETILHGGDRLTFVGRAELIRDLQNTRGLVPEVQEHLGGLDTSRHTFFEAVVGAASPLVGRTLKEVAFRGRYQAAVVAIHRSGGRVKAKLGEVRLKVGDTLMLLAGHDFRQRWRDRSDFLLVSRLGGTPPTTTGKAGLVGLIAAAIVLGAGLGLLPILHLSLLGALAIVLLGILTPGEARDAVDLDVILVIAGAFGLGAAIQVSGLAETFSGLLIQVFGGQGAIGALLGILLTTVALTTVVSNNTAAVLMFPIAWSTAGSLGTDQRVFVIALAIGASASFLTPIAYQTNLMVYGPGGYRFGDYARLGTPVTVAVIAAILILVPALGLL